MIYKNWPITTKVRYALSIYLLLNLKYEVEYGQIFDFFCGSNTDNLLPFLSLTSKTDTAWIFHAKMVRMEHSGFPRWQRNKRSLKVIANTGKVRRREKHKDCLITIEGKYESLLNYKKLVMWCRGFPRSSIIQISKTSHKSNVEAQATSEVTWC